MAFSFEEIPDSRRQNKDGCTLRYKATGEQNDLTVSQYAIAATPLTLFTAYGVFYRQDVQLDPDGWAQYYVTVPYGKLDSRSTPVGSYTFSFDTTGATVHIDCAKAHRASYPVNGDWHKGAIGVKAGNVEGADIVIPALKMTYTFKHPQGIITEAHARTLAGYTGMTNSAPFRGFEAGELLFAGATGSDGSEAEAECGYQFIASQNATGLTIGGITGIAKQGHDLSWVEFEDQVESGRAVLQPKMVHIEIVYDSFNFASVFGWG